MDGINVFDRLSEYRQRIEAVFSLFIHSKDNTRI